MRFIRGLGISVLSWSHRSTQLLIGEPVMGARDGGSSPPPHSLLPRGPRCHGLARAGWPLPYSAPLEFTAHQTTIMNKHTGGAPRCGRGGGREGQRGGRRQHTPIAHVIPDLFHPNVIFDANRALVWYCNRLTGAQVLRAQHRTAQGRGRAKQRLVQKNGTFPHDPTHTLLHQVFPAV